MTSSEYTAYLDAIAAAKLSAAQRMRCHMCLAVIEAVENGLNNRESLNAELRQHGVVVPEAKERMR